MKLITLVLISFISLSSMAKIDSCGTCAPLLKLAKAPVKSKNDLKKIQDTLMTFTFSKEQPVRSQEIQAYLKLVLKSRIVDKTTISAEYFYNFYEMNRETFNAEIIKMSNADQKVIWNYIKDVGELRKPDKLEQ